MSALHIYFATVILLQFTISSPNKSVSLTPSNPNTDGARAFCAHEDCTIISNEWHIASTDYIGFHIEIDLDSSWGFHQDQISTISLTIYSSQALDISIDLDALIVFSVDDSQYITHWLSLDQKYSNTIYPTRSKFATCDTKDPQTELAHGNIKQCVHQTSCHEKIDRGSKVTGGDNWGYIAPNNYPDNLNAWPMTIKITNDPIKQQTMTTITSATWNTWTQSCTYDESFHVEHGLQIYIATEDIGEVISFSQFDIEYQVVAALAEQTATKKIIWYRRIEKKIVEFFPYFLIGVALMMCFIILCIICIVCKLRSRKHRKELEKIPEEQHAHLPLSTKHVLPSNEEEEEKVRDWLNSILLPQYYSIFIDNGYDSLRYIKAIISREDLKTIGINNLGHQTHIIAHIKTLCKEKKQIDAQVPNVIDINALTQYAHAAYHGTDNSDSDTDEGIFTTKGGTIRVSKEDHKEEDNAKVIEHNNAQFVMSSGYDPIVKNNAEPFEDPRSFLSAPQAFDEDLYTTSIGGSWMISPQTQMEDDDDQLLFAGMNTAGYIS